MTEIPGDQARRPLDIFDSTADGFAPHTLEQTVQAARDVVHALERLDAALKGCATPLQLGTQRAQARAARIKAEERVAELSEAREIIERNLPISDTFPPEIFEGWAHEDPEPWNRDDGPSTLTPAAIVQLRGHAADLPLGRLTSYRREIERRNPVPALISRHRDRETRAASQAAWRATFTDAEYEAMWAKGRGERQRSYREFKLAAGSAGPDLVKGVPVRVDGDADLAGDE